MRDGDRYILPAWYTRPDDTLAPLARFAFVDVETDEVTYSPVDNRCGIEFTSVTDDGDIYFASPGQQSVAFEFGLAGDPASPPCVLRMRAGANAVDPTYFLDPASVIEPAFAGSLADGVDDLAFTLGYDESLVPLVEPINPLDTVQSLAWRLYGFSLATPEGETSALQEVPPSGSIPSSSTIDGVPYVSIWNPDEGRSRMYDVTDRLQARVGADAPGLILQALRVL